MAILGREALDERVAETLEVAVKAWGGSILLRKLSASEATRFMAIAGSIVDNGRITDPERMTRMLAQGIVWSWVDEAGDQVLAQADIDRLCKEPYEVLDQINDAIRSFNGLAKNATPVDDAKKNSDKTPSNDFGMS